MVELLCYGRGSVARRAILSVEYPEEIERRELFLARSVWLRDRLRAAQVVRSDGTRLSDTARVIVR
jgi:hypothetical protein